MFFNIFLNLFHLFFNITCNLIDFLQGSDFFNIFLMVCRHFSHVGIIYPVFCIITLFDSFPNLFNDTHLLARFYAIFNFFIVSKMPSTFVSLRNVPSTTRLSLLV